MKYSILMLCLILSSCSFMQQQQQQLQAGYRTCEEEAKKIRQRVDNFKARVMKAAAARLHITTGDEKKENSTVHLSEEELGSLKTIVQAIRNAPPMTRSSWRIGSNTTGILRVGYSTFKSIHFLDNEGRELASMALNHDSDEEQADGGKHEMHSRNLPPDKQDAIDALPTVSSYCK